MRTYAIILSATDPVAECQQGGQLPGAFDLDQCADAKNMTEKQHVT